MALLGQAGVGEGRGDGTVGAWVNRQLWVLAGAQSWGGARGQLTSGSITPHVKSVDLDLRVASSRQLSGIIKVRGKHSYP